MQIHRFFGAVVLSSILGAAAAAQNPEPLGAPPQFVQIETVDREADRVELRMIYYKTILQTKEEAYEVKGEIRTRTVSVPHTVSELQLHPIRLDEVRIVTAGKERLDKTAALERLKPGMLILRHTSGTKFDARYLSVLHPDAIIFIEKPAAPVAPMPPAAPAAPVPRVAPPVPAPAPVPPTAPQNPG